MDWFSSSWWILLVGTFIQNASFTLVSRARNSRSVSYHFVAAILSNSVWLFVISRVVTNIDSWAMRSSYMIGAVLGSIVMHFFAMRFVEKGKRSMDPTKEIEKLKFIVDRMEGALRDKGILVESVTSNTFTSESGR